MPKKLEVPFYLSSKERLASRNLYQSVFPEDTDKFVDYYYQYKIRDNEILAIKKNEQIVSMVHLNPYTMIINGYETKINYIVAVATDERYRRQGYMHILMEKVLRDMAQQEMPFVFLMPASESLYTSFDFVRICSYTKLPGCVEVLNAEEQNRYLAARYQMFCKRDERYMENQNAEKIAEQGEIPSEKMPPYMARITDVQQMLKFVFSKENRELVLKIKDDIIEKNNGYFLWHTSAEENRIKKLDEKPIDIDLEMTVGELASMIFSGFFICLSEIV